MMTIDWSALENLTHRDPGGRGVVARQANAQFLDEGQLARAAHELALHGHAIGIVTGFTIADADPRAAETDGPPGALYLARVFHALGIEVRLLGDAFVTPLLVEGCRAVGLNAACVHELPIAPRADDHTWLDAATRMSQGTCSHLLAIERVGPSHTLASLVAQARDSAAPVERFAAEVPIESRDVCHTMRGIPISHLTAPAHCLFELPGRTYRTIGIGDGGNEIGMGAIPWAELRRRLSGEQAGRVPCRIACDFNIVAGTSNWGAMALAAGVCLLRGRLDVLQPWTRERHREWLENLVANGPAVDGVTGRSEATVDGLPFLTYIQPWEGILRRCGISS